MIRKPRILVVGIFVMDLIASTKQAPNRGETVIGLNFRTAPGGKGASQAVQCARLGADVTMVGRVGSDAYGRETVAAAAASGVDVSRVVVDAENPTGVPPSRSRSPKPARTTASSSAPARTAQ